MEDKLDKIEGKLDKLDNRLDSMDIHLARQGKDLSYHIKRTDLLEESVKEVKKELEPIKAHVSRVDGALRFLGVISLLISILGGILKLLKVF